MPKTGREAGSSGRVQAGQPAAGSNDVTVTRQLSIFPSCLLSSCESEPGREERESGKGSGLARWCPRRLARQIASENHMVAGIDRIAQQAEFWLRGGGWLGGSEER